LAFQVTSLWSGESHLIFERNPKQQIFGLVSNPKSFNFKGKPSKRRVQQNASLHFVDWHFDGNVILFFFLNILFQKLWVSNREKPEAGFLSRKFT
jgi:hypothetical protein